MVTEHGIYTQPAIYTAQFGRSLVEIVAVLDIGVKNIPRDDDDVRLTSIDLIDCTPHLCTAYLTAEVQVRDQRYFQPISAAPGQRNVIRRPVHRCGVDDTVSRNTYTQRKNDTSDSTQRPPTAEGRFSGNRRQPQQQCDKIRRSGKQQYVQKHTDRNTAGNGDRAGKCRCRQHVTKHKKQRQQHKHHPENIGALEIKHRPKPANRAQADINDCSGEQENHSNQEYGHNKTPFLQKAL